MAPRSDCPLRKGKLSKVKPRRHSKYLSEALYSAGLSLPQGRCLVTAKPQGGTCPKATPESVAVGGATATVACFPRCPTADALSASPGSRWESEIHRMERCFPILRIFTDFRMPCSPMTLSK